MALINLKGGSFVDLPIITFQENKFFVSYVPFLYVTGMGKTREESIKDLMGGIETYFHGENVEKILKEKMPARNAPVSMELLRFNVSDNKLIPATNIL